MIGHEKKAEKAPHNANKIRFVRCRGSGGKTLRVCALPKLHDGADGTQTLFLQYDRAASQNSSVPVLSLPKSVFSAWRDYAEKSF